MVGWGGQNCLRHPKRTVLLLHADLLSVLLSPSSLLSRLQHKSPSCSSALSLVLPHVSQFSSLIQQKILRFFCWAEFLLGPWVGPTQGMAGDVESEGLGPSPFSGSKLCWALRFVSSGGTWSVKTVTLRPCRAKLFEAEVLPKLVSSVTAAYKAGPQTTNPCRDGPDPS